MVKTKYPVIMNFLKLKLKHHRISYKTLAETLSIPESTLKKWFTAEDGSYNRIASICEALGLAVHAVLKELEEQNLKTFSFTREQQSYFLKDFDGFKVYWLMVYERKNQIQTQSLLNLKPQDFKRILLKLDGLSLIYLGAGDKVKVPKMRPVKWIFTGAFMEELCREWTAGIIKDSQNSLSLQFFQLTPDSEKDFLWDLKMLEEKYARRTILELSGNPEKLKKIRYLTSTAEGSYVL